MPPHLSRRYEEKQARVQKTDSGYRISYPDGPDSSSTIFMLRFDSLVVPDSILALAGKGLFDPQYINESNRLLSQQFRESNRRRDSLMSAWMEQSAYQPVDFPSIYYVSLVDEQGKLFSSFLSADSHVVFLSIRWGMDGDRFWKIWTHFIAEHPGWSDRYFLLVARDDIAG